MKKTIHIDITPYAGSLSVCIGYNDEEFKNAVLNIVGEEELKKKKHKNFEKIKDAEAYALQFDDGITILRFRKITKKYSDIAIVSHEIYHSVCYILRYSGVKPTKGAEEAYAYLIQHITEQLYQKLFKK